MIPVFTGKVSQNKLSLDKIEDFNRYLIKFEQKQVILTVKTPKETRSANQNKYYWGVVIKILSDELGYFPDEMHQFLADKFLGFNKEICGRNVRIVPSTTKLKTNEMEEYLSKCRMFASIELSISIPEPNECEY